MITQSVLALAIANYFTGETVQNDVLKKNNVFQKYLKKYMKLIIKHLI